MFKLFRSYQIDFYINSTILHSHQQCLRVQISPHPQQHLSFSVLIIVILGGMKWYLIVVPIYTSLMTNVKHLFMWLSVISMSLQKCSLRSFSKILIFFFLYFYCYTVSILFIIWILNSYFIYDYSICCFFTFMIMSFCAWNF